MKQKEKSQSAILPAARIFLDDVEEILQTLGSVCKETKISDDEFDYESIDELIQKRGRNPNQLELKGHFPHIFLKFNRREVVFNTHLYTSGDNLEAEAGFSKIKRIILRRKRWFNYFLNFPIAITLFLLFFLIPDGLVNRWLPFYPWALWVFLAVVLYFVISMLARCGWFYSINLQREHEVASFWNRNRDSIVVAIITAIVTGIITFAITRYFANCG